MSGEIKEEKVDKRKRKQPEVCIVFYGYAKNQTRQKYDGITGQLIDVPVDDDEKKIQRAFVKWHDIKGDNGFRWMLEQNTRLRDSGKDNTIRIIRIVKPNDISKEEDTKNITNDATAQIVEEA